MNRGRFASSRRAPRGIGRRRGRLRRRGCRSWICSSLVALLGGVLLGLTGSARAANEVTLAVEPEAVQAGEQAVLTVSVDGASRLNTLPDIAHPPAVQLRSAGQSTNVSIVNGRMSRSVTFNFVAFVDQPGEYVLGPAQVKDGDRILRSGTVKLVVVGGGGGGSGGASGAAPAVPGRGGVGRAEDVEGGNEAVFARVVVDKDHVRIGEQVLLRFRVYRRLDVAVLDVNLTSIPPTEGFWREDLPPERNSQVTVNGRPYEVNELVYAIFPTQSGRLEIGPGEVECIVQERGRASRDPFDIFGVFPQQRRLRLRSKPVAVRVDPLPEPKPGDFTGGVGDFRLSARCEPAQVAQNEPVTLILTVEGTGNVSTVGDPEIPRLPGVRSYPSGADVQTNHRGDVVAGTKTFKVMLVPENTGRREIPPIRFSIFDPERGAYRRLESQPLSFQVVPGAGGSSGSGEVARIGRDLRMIRESSRFPRAGAGEPWRSTGFWCLQLLPLALVGAGFAWRQRRERREADWGRILSRGAPGRLQRDLQKLSREGPPDPAAAHARLDAIVERYFTDRFHLPVRGMTRDELARELTERGASEAAVASVRTLLDRCDFARFAPGTQGAGELAELIALAAALPPALEGSGAPIDKKKRPGLPGASAVLILSGSLAAGLGSVPGTPLGPTAARAASISKSEAAAAFARGNEAYRAGDFHRALQEYGAILAGGRESADLDLNLGNAAYRSGLLGWSVYFFERGRRLAPADPDLRANLEIVQQEAKDRIPEAGESRFLSGLVALEERGSLRGALHLLLGASWLFGLWAALRLALGEPAAGPPRWVVRASGFLLGAALALAVVLVFLRAAQSWTSPNAVVVAEECAVRSNPEAEATVEFTLHAGTRVRVGRESRGFREVLFSDKLRGWGAADALALLGGGRPADLPRAALGDQP